MTECPKCGFETGFESECARCGVVFSRWRAPAVATPEATPEPSLEAVAEPEPARGPHVDSLGWACFGGGLVAAFLALQFWPTQAALGAMTTLVHEMGHAAFGWLFGYPSIPAFDFSYGGGVTLQQDRIALLGVGVAAALAYAAYAMRERAPLRNALLAALALYVPLALTRGHEAAILAMGHGGELCFATLALHRALSGRGCKLEAERPLYGLIGWFIVLSDVRFAWQLRTSAIHRELYEEAKGGGHWMDFSRLANEFFHVPLDTIVAVFLALLVVPPLAALALQRLRRD
ncbi:MAG: hypothetical protein FJ091_07690 [Deltaproteobacteria bacterium]|nr:hypothetical protein [Deltaproteobacteria bacterium]